MTLSRSCWARASAGVVLLIATGSAWSRQPDPPIPPAARATFDQTIAAAKLAMLRDPIVARRLGRVAHDNARGWPLGMQRELAVATAQWLEGEGAFRASDVAAAAPLVRDAIAITARIAPQSRLHADLLLSHARLSREGGRPQEALADIQRAYNIFSMLKDDRSQAKALQSIGSIYQDAQDYNRVLFYYRSAEDIYSGDDALDLAANNNMADAFFHLRRFGEAEKAYDYSLAIARKMQSQLLEARILDNIADLSIENNQFPRAAEAIAAGLKLTASPAAASWRPMLLGGRAKLNLAQGRLTDAARDVDAALALAGGASDTDFSAVQLTAYRVYKAGGDTLRALNHLEAYRRTDGQSRALAASTNAALMTARFDFANQNARIATLKAGQLSRDVALTRLRARQSTVVFSSVLALLLVAFVFLFIYLRSVRRSRNAIVVTNARLAQTNTELGAALDAKSQFLATTSHEIRTPLNGILGMTQVMLADRGVNGVNGVVRDRITLVDLAGRAMRTLVDDILDFAKMDAGAVRLDTAAVDLTTVLPDLISLWRVQAHGKGIGLRLTITGVERPLTTDPARLRQVVFNLLSNAIKFTAAGEVTVAVRGDSGTIAIVVADTGIGIPADALQAIFEPFRQVDTSTTRRFGGTGLGLAISRTLARALGGEITVTSSPRGSVFTLTLPYTVAATTAVAGDAGPATTAVAVLIVSDNPIRRSFLRAALADAFGAVASCDTAAVAAQLAARHVGVVVMDLADTASAADADRLLAAARAEVAVPPVVVLVTDPRAGPAATAGVTVAVKPLPVAELVEILRGVCGAAPTGVLVTIDG